MMIPMADRMAEAAAVEFFSCGCGRCEPCLEAKRFCDLERFAYRSGLPASAARRYREWALLFEGREAAPIRRPARLP